MATTRICVGRIKGHVVQFHPSTNLKPTAQQVRLAVFSMIKQDIKNDKHILDLYAGTGSFGLECLSRQAKNVFFIENEKSAFEILEKNIEKLKIKKKTKIFFNDVFNIIEKQKILLSKFDLIFCDPPFKDKNMGRLIELIFNKSLLKENGVIILHRNKATKEKLPNNFKILDERVYGISKILFGKLLS